MVMEGMIACCSMIRYILKDLDVDTDHAFVISSRLFSMILMKVLCLLSIACVH
jgi:hypothetical protein